MNLYVALSDLSHRLSRLFFRLVVLLQVTIVVLVALWWVRCPPRVEYIRRYNALTAQHGGVPGCHNGHDAVIALNEQADQALEAADARGKAAWDASPESYDPANFSGWGTISWYQLLEPQVTLRDRRMREAVESAIADLEASGFFARLSALSAYECFTPPPRSESFFEPSASLLIGSSLGTLARARLNDALDSCDAAAIRARLADTLTLALVQAADPDWLSVTVGSRFISQVCASVIERCVSPPYLDEASLHAIAVTFDQPMPVLDVGVFMEGSRLIRLGEFGHPLQSSALSAFRSPKAYWAHLTGGTRARAEAIDKSWRAAAAMLAQPPGLRSPPPGLNDLLARAGAHERLDFSAPKLDSLAPTTDRPRMLWPATRVVVALERHRAALGGYPESLDDLSPRFLSEIPADPYDPDGRFRYRRIDADQDPFCRGYLLWSVGIDGEDNGGTTTPPNIDPWRTLWIRSDDGLGLMLGYDYVVNEPARPRE